MDALFDDIAPARSLGSHQSANAGTHTWLTPPDILAALGPFDLDPCACPLPRPWPTAETMWTREDGSLRREWKWYEWVSSEGTICKCLCHAQTNGSPINHGLRASCPTCIASGCEWRLFKPRVWCNPPFGPKSLVSAFMRRMVQHEHGTCLLFARTETEIFFEAVWEKATAILFLKGRPHFHHHDGRRAGANSGAPVSLIAYGQGDADRLRTSGIPGRFLTL